MFSSDLTDFLFSHRTVKCTKHNWKLNMLTMKYMNPPDSFVQDELGTFLYGALTNTADYKNPIPLALTSGTVGQIFLVKNNFRNNANLIQMWKEVF